MCWEPPMGGWEPKSSQLFCVTRLRRYAVTHMLLYNQLYPLAVLHYTQLFLNATNSQA